MRLIEILSQAGPEPMSRERLIEALGLERGTSVRNLDAAVYRLRKKIEDATGQAAPLKTVHGLGYSLKAPVGISPAAGR
jgi:DNA-binding response OmpR family regulator